MGFYHCLRVGAPERHPCHEPVTAKHRLQPVFSKKILNRHRVSHNGKGVFSAAIFCQLGRKSSHPGNTLGAALGAALSAALSTTLSAAL